ncbi:metallophosphoesterase [Neobacillus niacini]|uniref:metallophosphoesterase n=1 Tax=Neobacillus niacini TaxID=86668 RepID=UPI0021CAFEC2|nr:metallophosphoesterase [Neobacillus niacini]MCM3766537.1 metallophosphoesterase [Neobacillus niacini]
MLVYFVILMLIGAGLLLYMIKEAFQNKVTWNELCFSDFPSSFGELNIFFISDIHKRTVSDKIISYAKGKANLVIIGGDLAEKGVPIQRVKINLQKLKEIAPVYFVWGNNDYEIDSNKLTALMKELQITILDNRAIELKSNAGDTISLLGVKEMNQNQDRLDLALNGATAESFKILVSHYPSIINKILPEHGIRLVLSGHTHGGQIRIFGYGPYKRGGIEKLINTTLLVSNGYGTTAIPLRLGAPAECHMITLRRG